MNKLINPARDRNEIKLNRLLSLEPRVLKSKLIALDYYRWNSIPREYQQRLLNHAYSQG